MALVNRDRLLALQRPGEELAGDRKRVINDSLRHAMPDDVKEPNVDRRLPKLGGERALRLRTGVRPGEIEDRDFDKIRRRGCNIVHGLALLVSGKLQIGACGR